MIKIKHLTLDPTFKGTLMLTISQFLYDNKMNSTRYIFKGCKELYMMIPVIIYFPKHSYLISSMNRILERLVDSGLIEYWASHETSSEYWNIKVGNVGPKQLKSKHLLGPFQMMAIGSFLALLAFSLELFLVKLRLVKMPWSSMY